MDVVAHAPSELKRGQAIGVPAAHHRRMGGERGTFGQSEPLSPRRRLRAFTRSASGPIVSTTSPSARESSRRRSGTAAGPAPGSASRPSGSSSGRTVRLAVVAGIAGTGCPAAGDPGARARWIVGACEQSGVAPGVATTGVIRCALPRNRRAARMSRSRRSPGLYQWSVAHWTPGSAATAGGTGARVPRPGAAAMATCLRRYA
jgi:hypothetical protein